VFCLIQSKTAATGAKPDGNSPVQENANKKADTPIKVSLPLTTVVQGPKILNHIICSFRKFNQKADYN
jgi:hypothetical protein